MKINILYNKYKNHEGRSPIAWFGYLRRRFAQVFWWESPEKKQIWIAAAPLASLRQRGTELTLSDKISHQNHCVTVDNQPIAQVQNWIFNYQSNSEERLSWWGCTCQNTTSSDDFYYNLYRYNFCFSGAEQSVEAWTYQPDSEKKAACLWLESWGIDLSAQGNFTALSRWRALTSPQAAQTQILDAQRYCQQNKAYLLPNFVAWEQQYKGDTFRFFRALASEAKEHSFFMDVGAQQWMGLEAKDSNLADYQADIQLEYPHQARSFLVPAEVLQVGLPQSSGLNYWAQAGARKRFALSAGRLNASNALQIETRPMSQAFVSYQNSSLRGHSAIWLDARSGIAPSLAAHQAQGLGFEKISRRAEEF